MAVLWVGVLSTVLLYRGVSGVGNREGKDVLEAQTVATSGKQLPRSSFLLALSIVYLFVDI